MLHVKSLDLGDENNRNMLELQKKVLVNIKNDKSMFRKELIKSKRWLDREDFEILQNWIENNFDSEHAEIANNLTYIEIS